MEFSEILSEIAIKQYNGDRSLFSKDTGIPYSTLTEYMNGTKKDPKLSLLKKIKNVDTLKLIQGDETGINTYDIMEEPQYLYGDTKDVELPDNAIPFFDLPVSAGKSTLDIVGASKFDGYLYNIPNVNDTEYVFPVYGFSMAPEVKEGALIGVRKIETWERGINTEHKYLVVTRDDRMIKYLAPDDEDDAVLWCISHNFPKFKIYKEDIIEIHRVTFVLNQ